MTSRRHRRCRSAATFRNRLGPGYATPDTIQRRFLETSGTIINDNDTITVVLNRRAHSPVLRQAASALKLTGATR